ncbi:MAG TPA: hypothetical protein VE172_11775 [Stackebrandtia sp.]|uniref:hypothetical protein n=1 Tax=Stackebrandtia sp. TaxID=2023065 RepID=UPI002D54F8B3|nr:hypothetical protein [Stackebrandtia sp.]HZE39477.1 hypothetical protein [Stackebrandtia sp.]
MTSNTVTEARLGAPGIRQTLRTVKALSLGYLTLSVLTMAFAVAMRHHRTIVTDAVWVRGSIVALSAVVTTLFAVKAARGGRAMFLRLRIVSAVMVVAIAVVISIPGLFPVWMRIEQGVCGLMLIGVVALVNGRRLREAFAAK